MIHIYRPLATCTVPHPQIWNRSRVTKQIYSCRTDSQIRANSQTQNPTSTKIRDPGQPQTHRGVTQRIQEENFAKSMIHIRILLWTVILISQITQVIQEICDIKGNKIPSGNKYHNGSWLLDTTSPTAQREHNKFPKEDNPCTQEYYETPPPHIAPGPTWMPIGYPIPKLLLYLLEEVRSIEPKHLLWILRYTPLLGNPGFPAVGSLEVLHPHPIWWGKVHTNVVQWLGVGKRTGRRSWRWRRGRGQEKVFLLKP